MKNTKNILGSMIVKAAAVQISPVLYSRQGTVEKVVKKIRELGQQGVQFATFPETIVPYYPYFSYVLAPFALAKEHLRLLEESVTVLSAETRAIAQSSKTKPAVLSMMKSGTNTSFGSLRQIDAGVINVGYAEVGLANGRPVILLY
jgi:nitrilase